MKTTEIKRNEAKNYPFVVELAAFSDCGITEYYGADTYEEAERVHSYEDRRLRESLKEDYPDHELDTSCIRKRPNPEQDGDFPPVEEWEEV